MSLRVLELYCGIGGMHFALKRLGISYKVVAAMEINTSVLETYAFNFPDTNISNRNILSLTAKELNELTIDMIVMSPPCQPFCRSGLHLDTQDARTDSLCHLLNIFPEVDFQYILLENVKGFEVSDAHTLLLECLRRCQFKWQEFLLTPTTVGIPNSRLRYYLIGKRAHVRETSSWSFQPSEDIMTNVPYWSELNSESDEPFYRSLVESEQSIWDSRRQHISEQQLNHSLPSNHCVGDILQNLEEINPMCFLKSSFGKYYQAMDVVNIFSTNTCCFTKSYGTYVKGTGSILDQQNEPTELKQGSTMESTISQLRFFSPREVARLMCFPDSFNFPPNCTLKQQYKALGNSLNVYVVSILLSLLLQTA